MQALVILTALVASCCAYQCPPNPCKNVVNEVLNCPGGITKGSGWCGCTDSCAKLEGEECSLGHWSIPNTQQCDEGLTCKQINLEGKISTICVNEADTNEDLFVSKRIVCTDDMCDSNKEELNCKGKVISSGFCGCTKTCAKVLGEACKPALKSPLTQLLSFGDPQIVNTEACDEGLVCHKAYGASSHICINEEDADKFVS